MSSIWPEQSQGPLIEFLAVIKRRKLIKGSDTLPGGPRWGWQNSLGRSVADALGASLRAFTRRHA